MGIFVLILVLFLLLNREDLGDRIVRLFGQRRVSLTTRTMEEVGQRISRYLAMFVTVNSAIGLVVGLGLWAIGVPYAAPLGVPGGGVAVHPVHRAGDGVRPAPASSRSPTSGRGASRWWSSALFGVIEALLNSFLEPVIYGKTTGVSALVCWWPPCSGPGSGGRSGCCSRRR